MKKFQRFKQQGLEIMGRGERSDELTEKLMEIEKKVEGIRNGCLVTTKKLAATIQGSGSTVEKHQRKLPHYILGMGMQEAGTQLGEDSLFGSILTMIGQAEQEIAVQQTQNEIQLNVEVINAIETMLAEDMKKVDKSRKKLHSARLDMDSAKGRLKSLEHQTERSSREYPMGKLDALRADVEEAIKKFEDCQDAYATDMFAFLGKEQIYTHKLQQLVKQQLSYYKQATASLEHMLPHFDKKIADRQDQPVFGQPLEDHLRAYKCEIAVVIEECISAIRESWMDTEGLFRLAASSAKTKFLKSAFDAGQRDLSGHDPHTIAGCLKMYLRELPEPLLTYELYPEWMQAAGLGDYNERLQALWVVKEKLPKSNLNHFKYLMCFLRDFAQYSELTKMNSGNIAIVFGPNLLWSKVESSDPAGMVTDTALQRRLAETFIDNCQWFFPDLPEASPPSLPPNKPSPSSPPNPTTPAPTPTPIPVSVPIPTPIPVPVPTPTPMSPSPVSIHKESITPPPKPKEKEKEKEKEKDSAPMQGTPPIAQKPSRENTPLPDPLAGIIPETTSHSKPPVEKPLPYQSSPKLKRGSDSLQPPPPTAPKPAPRLVAAPRPSLSKTTEPPSPVPKPRKDSVKKKQPPVPLARTGSSEQPNSPQTDSRPESTSSLPESLENSVNGNLIPVSPAKAAPSDSSERPTPPTRTKRQATEGRKTSGRPGPSRPAPPPPTAAKKPVTNNTNEEISEL